MENRRLPVPEDVFWEILSRLPVKSVLRFRCVSKSWLSLISDPEFCGEHCKNLKNNRDETHLLVFQSNLLTTYCVVRCSETFETTTIVELPPLFCTEDWIVDDSIDGLYLLEGIPICDILTKSIVVWNPSIRKFHTILDCISQSSFDFNLGLGYDPLVKDHKYVKLSYLGRGALKSVELYTLKSRSWKSVEFQGKNCSEWHWNHIDSPSTVYLQGIFYFICINLNNNVLELVSFDLCSEAFSVIRLPPVFCSPVVDESGRCVLFGNGDSSLTLLHLRCGKVTSAVLQIDSLSWSKPCSLNLNIDTLLFVKNKS